MLAVVLPLRDSVQGGWGFFLLFHSLALNGEWLLTSREEPFIPTGGVRYKGIGVQPDPPPL